MKHMWITFHTYASDIELGGQLFADKTLTKGIAGSSIENNFILENDLIDFNKRNICYRF